VTCSSRRKRFDVGEWKTGADDAAFGVGVDGVVQGVDDARVRMLAASVRGSRPMPTTCSGTAWNGS